MLFCLPSEYIKYYFVYYRKLPDYNTDLFKYSSKRCQRRRSLLQHGQTGRQTVVENLSTFNDDEFGVINRMPVPQKSLGFDHAVDFYQMGEEGNSRDPYELHTTRYMKRLAFRDFTISTKYPNNVVLVKALGVCAVNDIFLDREADAFRVVVTPFAKQTDFFKGTPCNSSDFQIYMVYGGLNVKRRATTDAKDIINQFVCLLYKKAVNVDADMEEYTNVSTQPSTVAAAMFDKRQSVFVCMPLLHALFSD